MSNTNSNWLLSLLLLVGLAVAALWHFRMQPAEPPAHSGPPAESAPANPEQQAPLYPVSPLPIPPSGELVSLPALDDSDAYFRLGLKQIFGRTVDELLVESGLIDRSVASVDNLPRRHVNERIRPVRRLSGSFQADAAGAEGRYLVRADNAFRYNPLVNALTAAEIDDIVEMYRRFYPLLQEAYVRLGYPNGYFNDRVVEVIDHLLQTPQPDGPVHLVRPNVLYEYADPELEALSGGQKLLLRSGNDNASRIKLFLSALRDRLASLA